MVIMLYDCNETDAKTKTKIINKPLHGLIFLDVFFVGVGLNLIERSFQGVQRKLIECFGRSA